MEINGTASSKKWQITIKGSMGLRTVFLNLLKQVYPRYCIFLERKSPFLLHRRQSVSHAERQNMYFRPKRTNKGLRLMSTCVLMQTLSDETRCVCVCLGLLLTEMKKERIQYFWHACELISCPICWRSSLISKLLVACEHEAFRALHSNLLQWRAGLMHGKHRWYLHRSQSNHTALNLLGAKHCS